MTRWRARAYTRGVRNPPSRLRDSGLGRDLSALWRYRWLPLVTLVLAVATALIIGAVRPGSSEARFRENVLVDALPPLFGPAVLPSPFDYARLATSDGVFARVSQESGVPVEQLHQRLTAEARFNRPEVDFTVTGSGALTLARGWQQTFADAAATGTPDIERLLVQPYARQLDQTRALLDQRAADVAARPDDAAARQQLVAAQENYETAAKLSQSYEIVARSMKAAAISVVGPHAQTVGIGSTAGRLGAAVAIGLLAGVAGALVLDYARGRRPFAGAEPAPIDARPALRRRSRT